MLKHVHTALPSSLKYHCNRNSHTMQRAEALSKSEAMLDEDAVRWVTYLCVCCVCNALYVCAVCVTTRKKGHVQRVRRCWDEDAVRWVF